MPFGKRLLLFALVLLLGSAVVTCLLPIMVADGLRLFVLWKSRELGVTIELGQIESTFFKPVIVHRVRLKTTQPCSREISMEARQVELGLNLRALFFPSAGRLIHFVAIDDFHGRIESRAAVGNDRCRADWALLHRLLPDQIRLSDFNLDIENGATNTAFEHVDLNADEIESGKFSAKEIRIVSPFLHQRFFDLLGATTWENEQFTIGALSLARGLDLQTLTADLSHLDKKHLAFDLNVDAFGGKLRAGVATENRGKGILWDVAGTASQISLEQVSRAIGLDEPAGGSVHASKFTFRGDTQDLSRATASVWMEVSGLTWRDRRADTVMLGASLYNRQVDVTQLYVTQRQNQLNLSGQYALPSKSEDWLNPNFRADISAAITDLGQFAHLFGASADDFSGSLSITGTLNGRNRNVGGQLTAHGASLYFFNLPADALDARMSLKGSRLIVDEFEARHEKDVVHGKGDVDLAGNHSYSANVRVDLARLKEYWPMLPSTWSSFAPSGHVVFALDSNGKTLSHFGKFQVTGENIQLASPVRLLPFRAQIAGSYSPKNFVVSQCQLSSERALLETEMTIAPTSLEVRNFRLAINGKPEIKATLSLPIAFDALMKGRPFIETLDSTFQSNADVTIDHLSLVDFAQAVTGAKTDQGTIDARWQAAGVLPSLQSELKIHLRDYSQNKSRLTSGDLVAHVARNTLEVNLVATAGRSSPVKLDATLPLQLERFGKLPRHFLATDKPLSATADFPAVLLADVPHQITRRFRDGILSGKIAASHTLLNPQLTGDVQIVNGKFAPAPGSLTGIDGRISFNGAAASLDFAKLEFSDGRLPLHGTVDFANTNIIRAKLLPDISAVSNDDASAGTCLEAVSFSVARSSPNERRGHSLPGEISQVELTGAIGSKWSATFQETTAPHFLNTSVGEVSQTFLLCGSAGETLHVNVASQKDEAGGDALAIFAGQKMLDSLGAQR